MEPRPLADRVAGIDIAVCTHAHRFGLSDAEVVELRVAVADFTRRHGELLERLDSGEEPRWMCCDGLIPFWPDDAEIVDGIPCHGAELLPVAAAVLDAAADRTRVLRSAGRAAVALGEYARALTGEGSDMDLAEWVLLEAVEALVFTDVTIGGCPTGLLDALSVAAQDRRPGGLCRAVQRYGTPHSSAASAVNCST